MATLADLEKLQREITAAKDRADVLSKAKGLIADHRHTGYEDESRYRNRIGLYKTEYGYLYKDLSAEALAKALKKFHADICRVAEFNLMTEEREELTKARLLQSQLDAALRGIDLSGAIPTDAEGK